jgi:hypothetical protein
MIVEIGTVAAQFLFWEYLFQIYGIASLQCAAYQELQHTPHIFEVCQLITQRTILIFFEVYETTSIHTGLYSPLWAWSLA